MTDDKAQQHAVSLWGSSATIWYADGVGTLHHVGIIEFGGGYTTYGVGLTWEEAFADATAKGHRR